MSFKAVLVLYNTFNYVKWLRKNEKPTQICRYEAEGSLLDYFSVPEAAVNSRE